MIRRTKVLRVASILLAALPLAFQIAAEARQAAAPGTAPAPPSSEYFESYVRPVLAANCFDCHAEEKMGGLRLDSRDAMLKGGRSGPALVPGDPEKSLIIEAVRQTRATLKMPKGGRLQPGATRKSPRGGRLKPAEIEALTEWVRAGAAWPAAVQTASAGKPADSPAAAKPAPASTSSPAYVIKPEQRAFWSFQPLHASPAPAVSHTSWPKSDIDRFVLARLEAAGLA